MVLINKVDTAEPEAVEQVRVNVWQLNPRARVLEAESPVNADDESVLRGRRVLAVGDGPTLTHGGMAYGAAVLVARRAGAELFDPRPHAVGELARTLAKYPGLGPLLPAMGYGADQLRELEATIERCAAAGAEAVAVGTPIDLSRLVRATNSPRPMLSEIRCTAWTAVAPLPYVFHRSSVCTAGRSRSIGWMSGVTALRSVFHLTLLALAAVAFVLQLHYWNLLG